MIVKRKIKIAVIDMNNGSPNQGMRGIQEILEQYQSKNNIEVSYQIFDIRQKDEIPDLGFDAYISSGGPGSPFEGENSTWENKFFTLLEDIDHHNSVEDNKKYVFLICHSFQLACRKYKLGKVTKRKSNAFGIFPVSQTEMGLEESVFHGLTNPFYAVDSRDWQVIEPNLADFDRSGAKILAIEKERPHVALERCIMAIRFSEYMIGTQFHPEADPIGMNLYLLQEEKKSAIIANHGEDKYWDMLNSLENPDRIVLTQKTILPNFLNAVVSMAREFAAE